MEWYKKQNAINKIANERFKHGQSGSNGGERITASSGCMGSLLVKLVIFAVVANLVIGLLAMGYVAGSITFNNITNIETVSDFSMSQYFKNLAYLDRDAEFKVNSKSLNCYTEYNDALNGAKNPIAKLKRNNRFIYRGSTKEGSKTIIAIELISDKPVYCYAMLPEEWTGLSFWGTDPSKFITEIKKEKVK